MMDTPEEKTANELDDKTAQHQSASQEGGSGFPH